MTWQVVPESAETLAEALEKHQRWSLGMTHGTPDVCKCGARVLPVGGDKEIMDRRNAAFARHQAEAASGAVRPAAEVVTDLDAFLRLPRWTIVAQTWPYQGENPEPDLWRNVGGYWQSLTDKGDDLRYAGDAIWNNGAQWRLVYNPAALAEDDDWHEAVARDMDARWDQ